MSCGGAIAAVSVPLSVTIVVLSSLVVFLVLRLKKQFHGVSPLEERRERKDYEKEKENYGKIANKERVRESEREKVKVKEKVKEKTKENEKEKDENKRPEHPKIILTKDSEKLKHKLENDCINTPSVHAVNALMDIRDKVDMSETNRQNLNVVIQLIATKQLYDYHANNFKKQKEIDSETSKFLIEYTTNIKRSQAAQVDGSMMDDISSMNRSKSDLRKAIESLPKKQKISKLVPKQSPLSQKVSKNGRSTRYSLESLVRPMNVTPLLQDAMDEEDEFFGEFGSENFDLSNEKNSAVKLLETYRTTQIFSTVQNWSFDASTYYEGGEGHGLYLITFEVLDRLKLFEEFPIDRICLHRFMRTIEASYNDNFYHNAKHASDVVQAIYWIISNNKDFLDNLLPVEKLALIIGAACHDVGHPGVNNAFLVNVEDPIAITYNDVSVLENMHASRMFELLHMEDLDFIASLELPIYRKFRQLAIDVILATDMSKHASIVSEVKTLIADKKIDFTQESVRLTVMKMIIKTADISNSTRPWEVCQKWANWVMNEFFYQGDLEKERELTISAMMDRTITKIPKTQIGFCQFVVLPLAQTITSVLPECHVLVDNITGNIEEWKKLEASEQ